jgi:hypothetical protein
MQMLSQQGFAIECIRPRICRILQLGRSKLRLNGRGRFRDGPTASQLVSFEGELARVLRGTSRWLLTHRVSPLQKRAPQGRRPALTVAKASAEHGAPVRSGQDHQRTSRSPAGQARIPGRTKKTSESSGKTPPHPPRQEPQPGTARASAAVKTTGERTTAPQGKQD